MIKSEEKIMNEYYFYALIGIALVVLPLVNYKYLRSKNKKIKAHETK